MRKFLLLFLSAFFLFSCKSHEDSKKDDAYVQSKEMILTKEQNNPKVFLSIMNDDKKNLLGKTVVKGVIYNSASIVSYENVRIQLLRTFS